MSVGFGQARAIIGEYETGNVVVENGDGYLVKSSARLQPCGYVVSSEVLVTVADYDNSIHTVGVAMVGRVLTHVEDRDNLVVGDVLCTGENGYASKMTEEEIRLHPDKILGVVAEIPDYEIWRDSAHQDSEDDLPYTEIAVKNRVWVRLG